MGITGNLDVPGGNCFYPAPQLNYPELWDKLPPEQAAKRLGGDRFKALNLTPYAYAHPPTLFRTILSEKPYPVKALDRRRQQYCHLLSQHAGRHRGDDEARPAGGAGHLHDADRRICRRRAAGRRQPGARRAAPPYAHQGAAGGMFMDTSSRKVAELAERRSDWEFIVGARSGARLRGLFPARSRSSPTRRSSRWA